MLQWPVGAAVLLIALIVSARSDPRKLRTALYLLGLIVWTALAALGLVLQVIETEFAVDDAVILLLVLLLVALGTVLALAGFLIVTGVTLIRKEGFAYSRLLSIALGAGMLGYLALWWLVLALDASRFAILLLLLGLPLGYLGFAFSAFLLYGVAYPAVMARRGGPVVAVIVLGSGLIRGQVPPLLAARLRRGRQLFDRFADARPVLVTSGGQGRDEPVAEGRAMADYLVADGVPEDRVLVEDASRNTRQNLALSAAVLERNGIEGPVAAVTNNFHALRAALLMRRLGIAGYTVGAPTARYYWPTAVIREFIAVLRDHLVLNAVLLALSVLPLVAFSISLLTGG